MHLIGSRYIEGLGIPFYRQFKDFDYLVREKDPHAPLRVAAGHTVESVRVEYHVNHVLHDWLDTHGNSLEAMYTLKLSHAFWNIHWDKTRSDIAWYASRGVVHIPGLFDELYAHWITVHGPRKEPNFKKANGDFFRDAVERQVDHDRLHDLLKFGDRPMFERIKTDLSRAEVDEQLFLALSHDDKVSLVAEELMVLSVERNAPRDLKYKPMVSNARMLKTMVLRLLPVWMAFWAVANFRDVLNRSMAMSGMIAGDRELKQICKI